MALTKKQQDDIIEQIEEGYSLGVAGEALGVSREDVREFRIGNRERIREARNGTPAKLKKLRKRKQHLEAEIAKIDSDISALEGA